MRALQWVGAVAAARPMGPWEGGIGPAGAGREEDFMEEEILEQSLEGGDDCQEIKGRGFQEERKVWTKPLRCQPVWSKCEISKKWDWPGRAAHGAFRLCKELGFHLGGLTDGVWKD